MKTKEIKISEESNFPLDYHFRGERIAMKPLFERLINELSKNLDFEYKVVKTYIGLKHRLVFAAIRVQTKKINVEFTIRKEVNSPRIKDSKKFQKSRWAYYVDISEPKEIDKELVGWLKASYE